MALAPKEEEVVRSLEKLKHEPITTDGSQDAILAPIYAFLINTPPNDNSVLHWFCNEAKPAVHEAAVFLLRLYAYTENPRVEIWKKKLASVLNGCCSCVQAFNDAKTSSRNTYFGAFSKPTLDTFFETLETWEVSTVLDTLKEAGLSPGSCRTLSDVPSAVLYHILTTVPVFFENVDILRMIREHPPELLSSGWAVEVPPGILLLMLHEKHEVRTWARRQVAGSSPVSEYKFSGAYEEVLQAVASALSSGAFDPHGVDKQPDLKRRLHQYFTIPQSALWSGLLDFLRLLPPTLLVSQTRISRQVCQAIIGHLHDTGPHFLDVLRAFMFLMEKLGKSLWESESSYYPQIVFDSIKDNPAFINLIEETGSNCAQRPIFLEWFQTYICSLCDSPIFEDVLRKFIGFMCEELQHERFEDKRPMIMESVLLTLQTILHTAKTDNHRRTKIVPAVIQVMDIHADIIVDVAFASNRKDVAWSKPRAVARQLLNHILAWDANSIEVTTFQLSDVLQQSISTHEVKRKYDLRPPLFHRQMWKKIYDAIDGDDKDGIASLISLLAPFAYLDTLSPEAFNPPSLPPETRKVFSTIIHSVNTGLKTMRSGFLDAIIRCTNSPSSTSHVLQSMMRPADMVKHVVALLLSPVEELQIAAQTLLGQAYDVDVRSDCFRALIKDLPDPSISGLTSFITAFNDCAGLFPEACSIAKSVVRCMTEIIEVLTNAKDGLLFDETFGAVPEPMLLHMRLPTLWRLMCSAITIIFRRTPLWSKYYPPEVMIDWMRDALIFARDLLSQRRTFESASAPVAQKAVMTLISPRKPSQIGKQMLENLQTVFAESIRWLRLTDMELLHQSSNLVQSLMDCFREAEFRPPRDALLKLERFLDSARRKSSPDAQTKLSEAHLSDLTASLSYFNQEDEEIQITGEFKPGKLAANVNRCGEAGGDSRWRGSQTKHIPEQERVGTHASNVSERPIKADSSIASQMHLSLSRLKSHREEVKGTISVSPHSSLMVQARSQAARHGAFTDQSIARLPRKKLVPVIVRSPRKKLIPVKTKENTIDSEHHLRKDEVGSTKPVPSSSSSSGDSDEDGTTALTSLVKLQKSPLIKKKVERRSVKLLELELTEKNPAINRIRNREEARRAALRMKPDMKPLYRMILSWNYDHGGPEPPTVGTRPDYLPVADIFQSDEAYQRTFEPLLTLECWNQLIKSKEETIRESLLFKINSRQFIDDWLDLDVLVTDRPPDNWRLVETDIILLRPSCGETPVLAKVQSSQRMPQGIQATLRCLANSTDPGLYVASRWRMTRVFSLSTIAREFAALKTLPYFEFYSDIMRPRQVANPSVPDAHVKQAMKSYQVNEPQAIAIINSLQVEGFSLIQGPPGTGKTWTICGIIGAFLSSRPAPATLVHAGRKSVQPERASPKKILVCAPSNAAIDEVSKRLKHGVRNSEGRLIIPNIVRVGADDAINLSVRDISLDQLVKKRLDGASKEKDAPSTTSSQSLASLRADMETLRNARAEKLNEMADTQDNVSRAKSLEDELKEINRKRLSLFQQYNRLKDQQQSETRTLDAARRKYRAEVLLEADIICATLSGSGHEILQSLEFEMVIIDEAAQSIELSSLIPLKYKSKRCILVGDPQQLPPTVLSPLANKCGYGQSLFVRLQRSRPGSVHLLSIQYRMHPDISRLPSKLFYDQRLNDGPDMDKKTAQPWHSHPLFGTYRFINVSSGTEQQAHTGHSLVNRSECDIAVALYNRLKTEFPRADLDLRIGIITMYRAQVFELKKKFQTMFGFEILNKVDFNTVDGFQGQEKDIIILSCVRAGPAIQSIGFLADQRRLNVAITRSRCSLFIIGHAATLARSDGIWREIVKDAQGSSRWLEADLTTFKRHIIAASSGKIAKISPVSPNKSLRSSQSPSHSHATKAVVGRVTRPLPSIAAVPLAPGPVSESEKQEAELTSQKAPSVSMLPMKRHLDESNEQQGELSNTTNGGTSRLEPPKPVSHPEKRQKEASMLPMKRHLEESDEQHPEQGKLNNTNNGGTSRLEPPKPVSHSVKKRQKEVSIFIPKKKDNFQRTAENTSRDAKRRLTEKHYS